MRFCVFLVLSLLTAMVQAEQSAPANQVSFNVTAAEEIDSDLLVVRLYVQHEGRKQAEVANRVNEDMAWALAVAKSVAAVRAQTLDYRTNPIYNDRKIQSWQTRQTLRLESADKDALTALLGTLQERLAIESVGYEISPAVRAAAIDRLTGLAIELFSARARRIAQSFERQSYSIVSVNINDQGGYQPPVAYRGRTMALQAEMADPSIAPGQQSLGVTINGSIELSAN